MNQAPSDDCELPIGDDADSRAFWARIVEFDEALASGKTLNPNHDETFSRLPGPRRQQLDEVFHCIELVHRVRRLESSTADNGTHQHEETVASNAGAPGHFKIGRFEVLHEIGCGGHGVVFCVNDPVLRRSVALKIPRPEFLFSTDMRRRFVAEAQAAAALDHPNIVKVFEAGLDGTVGFIAQELCRGGSLETWLRGRTDGIEARLAAGITVQVSSGLAHAHERGILHRDVKPANILLKSAFESNDCDSEEFNKLSVAKRRASEDGFPFTPKLGDFGICKAFDEDADHAGTRTGAVIGTAAYMSPEQAAGQSVHVGPPSDVYALGAVLYELLTGKPPFLGGSQADALRRTLTEQPLPPRRHRSSLPRDLEAICLKCLEKDPAERYQTADQLTRDLERFLTGLPVTARPVGFIRRGVKAYRRQRHLVRIAIMGAAVLIATIPLLVRRLAREIPTLEVDAEAQYTTDIRAAFDIWNENDERIRQNATAAGDMIELLSRHIPAPGQIDRRSFDWHYLWRLCHPAEAVGRLPQIASWQGHSTDAFFVTFSPDGSRLASAGGDQSARVWDGMSGQAICVCSGHTGDVNCVDFSPDGKLLATASEDRTVKVWDATTGKAQFTITGYAAEVVAVVFSPDGKALVSGDHTGMLKQWDLVSRREIRSVAAHAGRINSLCLGADGHFLLSAGSDNRVRLWTMPELQLRGTQQTPSSQSAMVSSDGEMIACGGGQLVNIYDVRSGGLRSSYGNVSDALESVRFSPDGLEIASCGRNGVSISDRCTGQTWLAVPPRRRKLPTGELSDVGFWCVAYSPAGGRIATGARDGIISIWDSSTTPQWTNVPNARHPAVNGAFAFSADGSRLAIRNENGKPEPGYQIWDASSAHLKLLHQIPDKEGSGFHFSPDGDHFVIDRRRTIDVYDARTLERCVRIDLPTGTVAGAIGFDVSGSLLALAHAPASPTTTIHVYDVNSGTESRTIGKPFNYQQPGEDVRIAVSVGGKRLAALSQRDWTSSIDIYSLPDGHIQSIAFEPRTWIGDFALSPTEPLVVVRVAGELQFRDTNNGRVLAAMPLPERGPMEFSPDGRLLFIASCQQANVQIWDVQQRARLIALPLPREAMLHLRPWDTRWFLAMSPDGKKIACSAWSGAGGGGIYLYSAFPDETGPSSATQEGHAFHPDTKW